MLEDSVIEKILSHCLFAKKELKGGKPPDSAVIVKGINNEFGFHPERLEEKRDEIIALLKYLPDEFMSSVGRGWQFCYFDQKKGGIKGEEDNYKWTESSVITEVLLCLGIGIGVIHFLSERKDWCEFPENSPYLIIDL